LPRQMLRMNPRYAAALALLGWYLMVPPPGSQSHVSILQRADCELGDAASAAELGVALCARCRRTLRRNPHKVRAGRVLGRFSSQLL
jgi:hypothetical protein